MASSVRGAYGVQVGSGVVPPSHIGGATTAAYERYQASRGLEGIMKDAELQQLDHEVAAVLIEVLPGLFHFTDAENVPLMEAEGGILSLRELEARGLEVPRPGGNEWSREADRRRGLDRYVHLCLRANHPMEYRARQDGRIRDTRWLRVSTEVLDWEGVRVAPDIANKAGVELLHVAETLDVVDWGKLRERLDFSDPEQQKIVQRLERVEILVPTRVPWELVQIRNWK